MNFTDAQRLIDYFVDKFTHAQGSLSLEVAIGAAFLSFLVSVASLLLSFRSTRRQYAHSVHTYLAQGWYTLLDTAMANPSFIDPSKTTNYLESMSHEEILKYGAYGYRAWSLVQDVVARNYHKDKQFEQLISWVSAYHRPWLDRNPTFFDLDEFWDVVERYKDQANMVYECPRLPTKDGKIDWDLVAPDYLNYLLSPFAPEMVRNHRNLLLNYLDEIPDEELMAMNIADFGCGPGNLIGFLKGRVKTITGVDSSQKALDLAKQKATDASIAFCGLRGDIREVRVESLFDLIVSTNSILPERRSDIVPMWKAMGSALKPGGKIIAILPSFDTVEYLLTLWEQHYSATRSREQVDRLINAFVKVKNINRHELSYAEDGRNVQCYHTRATIESDLKSAGLRLEGKLEKVYYPWNLTKRFDYGYFPNAKEEIWDWFAVVVRDESAGGGEAKVSA